MIDKIAQHLFDDIKKFTGQFSEASEEGTENHDASSSQLKAIITAGLKKANVVTREEFDAQTAVLLRTREKLERLEAAFNEITQHN